MAVLVSVQMWSLRAKKQAAFSVDLCAPRISLSFLTLETSLLKVGVCFEVGWTMYVCMWVCAYVGMWLCLFGSLLRAWGGTFGQMVWWVLFVVLLGICINQSR